MGAVEKRTVVYDGDQPGEGNVLMSSSKTAIEDDHGGEKTVEMQVQQEAGSLIVAVSGPDAAPASEPPRGVDKVVLVHESGEQVQPVAPDSPNGRFIFVVEKPRPGRWRVFISHARESAFVVRAVALRDNAFAYAREKWPSLRCGMCVEGLHAAVAVAVNMLISCAGGPPAALLAIVVNLTGLREEIVTYIAERMFGTRMDKLVDGVCERMGMCAA